MSEVYQPPFQMTEEITNLIVEIGEYVGSITTYESMHQNPVLRRESRIKSIYSSLAIEQNTLSLDQVTDVIEGKRVLGPPQDIREVKNAYEAYERVSMLDPYSVKNLLLAHKLLMDGLVKEAGSFRSGNVGVYAGDQLIHAGTPAKYVPDLMSQLMTWLKESKLHPLVKSCIFHYEFEFIHPFIDGNGRTGRLWQSLILGKLHPLFEHLPVENMVYSNQQQYYDAITASSNAGQSGPFIDFMLNEIFKTLKSHQGAPLQVKVPDKVPNKIPNKLKRGFPDISDATWDVYRTLKSNHSASSEEIGAALGISSRMVRKHIASLREAGIIVRVGSNKTGHWEVVRKEEGV